MSKAKRLKMPAGCIDVTARARGTVISLIGRQRMAGFSCKSGQV
jgi:hypothetical protein